MGSNFSGSKTVQSKDMTIIKVSKEYSCKILMVGDVNVGKSSLLTHRDDNKTIYVPTMGVDFRVFTHNIKDNLIKIQLLDASGAEQFRNIITSYMKGVKIIMVMFDLTNKFSFDNVDKYIKDIKQVGSSPKIILVGNKSESIEERDKYNEEIKKYTTNNDITSYHEISVKSKINIDKLFDNMYELIMHGDYDNLCILS
jgi:small GTP-binding protein